MARARNPNRDKAKQMWLDSGKNRKLKDIAEELGVTPGAVRKWKSEDKWAADNKGNVTNGQKERYASAYGNQRAKGGPGGHPPKGNKNAMTHGLFANWLPDETNQIINSMNDRTPADLIWDQIQIQYAAIIRAQQIMYVADRDDLSDETSSQTWGKVNSETKAIEYAWDKQASFLAAQSRAMGTFLNLIKQFTAMVPDEDDRKQQVELMTASVDKAKAEAKIAQRHSEILTGSGDTTEDLLQNYFEKLGGVIDGTQGDLHTEADSSSGDGAES
jgi:uncharacterized protein YjcR